MSTSVFPSRFGHVVNLKNTSFQKKMISLSIRLLTSRKKHALADQPLFKEKQMSWIHGRHHLSRRKLRAIGRIKENMILSFKINRLLFARKHTILFVHGSFTLL